MYISPRYNFVKFQDKIFKIDLKNTNVFSSYFPFSVICGRVVSMKFCEICLKQENISNFLLKVSVRSGAKVFSI